MKDIYLTQEYIAAREAFQEAIKEIMTMYHQPSDDYDTYIIRKTFKIANITDFETQLQIYKEYLKNGFKIIK